jgi:hypothetical protein
MSKEPEHVIVLEEFEQPAQLLCRRPCRVRRERSLVGLHLEPTSRLVHQGHRENLFGYAPRGLLVRQPRHQGHRRGEEVDRDPVRDSRCKRFGHQRLGVRNRSPFKYGDAKLIDVDRSGVQQRPSGVQVVDHPWQETEHGGIERASQSQVLSPRL